MHKYRFLPVLLLAVLAACTSGNKYTIIGTVEDAYDGEWVHLMSLVDTSFVTVDSTRIVDGKFRFAGTTREPQQLVASFWDGENDPIFTEFYLEAGDILMHLAYDLSRCTATGTPANALMSRLRELTYSNYRTAVDAMNSVPEEQAEAIMDSVHGLMRKNEELATEMVKKYMAENPAHPLSKQLSERYGLPLN